EKPNKSRLFKGAKIAPNSSNLSLTHVFNTMPVLNMSADQKYHQFESTKYPLLKRMVTSGIYYIKGRVPGTGSRTVSLETDKWTEAEARYKTKMAAYEAAAKTRAAAPGPVQNAPKTVGGCAEIYLAELRRLVKVDELSASTVEN